MPPWRSPKTLLFSITFICSFLGAVNDPVQILPHQVNGVLNGTVLLPVRNNFTSELLRRIEWDFQLQSGTWLTIAEFRSGALERLNPNDQFGSRLELADNTSLRIRNLEKEDSGLYTARVRFSSAKMQEYFYHLEVYDSVPVPLIRHQRTSDSSIGCNVTLVCWLPEKEGLNVSWRIGDDLRTLEGSSDWYQLSSDGWRLHVSMWSSATESNFTCLVSNLVDQKHFSINLLSICSLGDGPIQKQRWSVFIIMVLWVFLAVIGTICICMKMRKWSTREADPATPRESIPEHPDYENQSKRNPPEMDNYQCYLRNKQEESAHDCAASEAGSPSKKSLMETSSTVYSRVQPHSHLSKQEAGIPSKKSLMETSSTVYSMVQPRSHLLEQVT